MRENALLTLVPRRAYDFGALGTNGEIEFPLAKNIPVEPFSTGVLLVRVHAVALASGAAVTVSVIDSLPAAEEPDIDFIVATPLAELDVGGTAPALKTASLALDDAAFVTVSLKGERLTDPGISATLSVDLVGRASS